MCHLSNEGTALAQCYHVHGIGGPLAGGSARNKMRKDRELKNDLTRLPMLTGVTGGEQRASVRSNPDRGF
jgi:hypothetical protein